ncbi:MAG: prefoldin subunit alpha [Candidatus Odinarchaeota archaeon]|nr:prefoldin subunit alpha [Candidatus Odinarchaeota archaeon]
MASDKVSELIYKLRLYESQAKVISEQLNLIELKINELTNAREFIENLKNMEEGHEVLLPIGGGIYIKARLADNSKVMMDLGANVIVLDSVDKIRGMVEEDIKKLNDSKNNLENQLNKIIEESRKIQEILQKYSQAQRGS